VGNYHINPDGTIGRFPVMSADDCNRLRQRFTTCTRVIRNYCTRAPSGVSNGDRPDGVGPRRSTLDPFKRQFHGDRTDGGPRGRLGRRGMLDPCRRPSLRLWLGDIRGIRASRPWYRSDTSPQSHSGQGREWLH
jgi:hypothetical protein